MLLQFKIQLKDISEPPVWRRVLVPDSFSFEKFHIVIQVAFGWYNGHLHQFSPKGYGSEPQIGMTDYESWDDEEIIDEKKIKLSAIFTKPKQKFTYIYDFGDDWIHTITLEKIIDDKSRKASLLQGQGACPPEDCGGPWGYKSMLEILANPKHEEHEGMREWLGLEEEHDVWDANDFDLAAKQKEVKGI